jgi:hypothetical protein
LHQQCLNVAWKRKQSMSQQADFQRQWAGSRLQHAASNEACATAQGCRHGGSSAVNFSALVPMSTSSSPPFESNIEVRSAAAGAAAAAAAAAGGNSCTGSNSCNRLRQQQQQQQQQHMKMLAAGHLFAKDHERTQLAIGGTGTIGTRDIGAAEEVQGAAEVRQGSAQVEHVEQRRAAGRARDAAVKRGR